MKKVLESVPKGTVPANCDKLFMNPGPQDEHTAVRTAKSSLYISSTAQLYPTFLLHAFRPQQKRGAEVPVITLEVSTNFVCPEISDRESSSGAVICRKEEFFTKNERRCNMCLC